MSNAELGSEFVRGALRVAFAVLAALAGLGIVLGAAPNAGAAPPPVRGVPKDELLARSFRRPLRIVGPAVEAAAGLSLLADAERAYDAVTLGLGMPAPDVDPATGLVTLRLAADAATDPVQLVREPLFAYDRAFAVPPALDPAFATGCARDEALATVFARASLARLAPAIAARFADAMAAALGNLATPCAAPGDAAASSAWLAAPWTSAAASASFWDDLDETYGAAPGQLLVGLADLAASKTDGHLPPRLGDPPPTNAAVGSASVVDVLRASFAGALVTGSTFDDVLLDAAVRRIFRDGGAGLAVDWRIDWPAAPRRIALTPLEPLGAGYVVVAPPPAASAGPPPQLRLEATWEDHATMRFAVLVLGADGGVLRRVDTPSVDKSTSAALTVADLTGAASVVVVATNTGDREVPLTIPLEGDSVFPSDARLEPHAALISLAAE